MAYFAFSFSPSRPEAPLNPNSVAAALDYSNLIFPFTLLVLGVAAAIIILITEKESLASSWKCLNNFLTCFNLLVS
jgi:hypothetical protein